VRDRFESDVFASHMESRNAYPRGKKFNDNGAVTFDEWLSKRAGAILHRQRHSKSAHVRSNAKKWVIVYHELRLVIRTNTHKYRAKVSNAVKRLRLCSWSDALSRSDYAKHERSCCETCQCGRIHSVHVRSSDEHEQSCGIVRRSSNTVVMHQSSTPRCES
jgi:hypothetical protein